MKLCEIINYGSTIVFSNQDEPARKNFSKCDGYLAVTLFVLCSIFTFSGYFFHAYFKNKKVKEINAKNLENPLVVQKVNQASGIVNKKFEVRKDIVENPFEKKKDSKVTLQEITAFVKEEEKINEVKPKETPVQQEKKPIEEENKQKVFENPIQQEHKPVLIEKVIKDLPQTTPIALIEDLPVIPEKEEVKPLPLKPEERPLINFDKAIEKPLLDSDIEPAPKPLMPADKPIEQPLMDSDIEPAPKLLIPADIKPEEKSVATALGDSDIEPAPNLKVF